MRYLNIYVNKYVSMFVYANYKITKKLNKMSFEHEF